MRVHRTSPLRDVLFVILAQVVTEVIAPMERRISARALGVVTEIGLLALIGPVLVLVMAVEVGVALEWDGFTARDETAIPVCSLESVGVSQYSGRESLRSGTGILTYPGAASLDDSPDAP